MKFDFVLAGAAAVAMVCAQPAMASGTLSSESLPSVDASAKFATSLADTSRVRKASRVGEAEGDFLWFGTVNPIIPIIGIVGVTFVAAEVFGFIDIFGKSVQVGPYGTVA